MSRCLLLAATVMASLWAAAPAQAYGPTTTHRWITRQAAELLIAAYPGRYDELREFIDEVAAGSEHEDDYLLDGDGDPTSLRVMRHFFRPTDFVGLTMNGTAWPSSYEWGVLPNEFN